MIEENRIVMPVLTPDRPEKGQNGRRFKDDGEPMFTLTGQDKHGVLLGPRIRRLTPLECSRLQGFPDSWCKYGIEYLNPETYDKDYADAEEADSDKILSELQEAVGKELREGRGFGEFTSLLKEKILRQKMYDRSLPIQMERQSVTPSRQIQSEAVDYCDKLWEMWLDQESGYSSQGQKHIEQLFVKLRGSLQKLPHKDTPKRLGRIFKMSDTQRYKMCGNAVTVNVIQAIGERIWKPSDKYI